MLSAFKDGDAEILSVADPIIPDGTIAKNQDRPTPLSQTRYSDDIQKIEPQEFVRNNIIIGAGNLRTALPEALGSLILLRRNRPDIGYGIARLSTESALAVSAATLATQRITMYNKPVRYAHAWDRKIAYAPLTRGGASPRSRFLSLRHYRLIIITDAGFGALEKSHPN